MTANDENKLKHLKLKVKQWESEFFQVNHRKPTKKDISNASADIKESYRNYWNLKKQESYKTDSIKDDVWGENLNKPKQKISKLKMKEPHFKNICNRIKQKSRIQNAEEIGLSNKNILPSKKDDLSQSLIKNDVLESSVIEDYSEDLQIKCDNENKDSPISLNRFKTIQSVNLINSTVGNIPIAKTLRLNQNLNLDWLERCSMNIMKTTKDVDEKFNFQTSLIDNKIIEVEKINFVSSDENLERGNVEKKETRENVDHTSNSFINENSFNIDERPENPKLFCETRIEESNLSPIKSSSKEKSSPVIRKNIDNEQPVKKRKLSKNSEVLVHDLSTSKKSTHLKRKIASGSLNENFIRLDIKKKRFSRGHRSVNTRKLKWNKWKQLKKNSGTDQNNVSGCFKCGQFGHWAKNCNSPGYNKNKTGETFEEEMDFDDMPLPTLEEAANLLVESNHKLQTSSSIKDLDSNNTNTEEGTANIQNNDYDENNLENVLIKEIVEPLYQVNENGKLKDSPDSLYEALNEMGYSKFRDGQETAIMRVLSGLSTVVVLPTGSGKSLCYQLPAYIYAKVKKSIAIVVSPLVSLMEDQVTGLPSCLHAVCLHSGMSDAQKMAAMETISDGKAQIVLVSPEAVISYGFIEKIQNPNMPPISFVCIDEVHCLSQWSHNFRPSYLQLYKVLTQKLNIKCILGLTATATRSAIKDIITHLNLQSIEDSVVGHTSVPPNLHLSISRDKDKDKALIKLLNGDRFHNCSSIIIYCIRRVETERLAALIRTCLQDEIKEDTDVKSKRRSKKRNFLWTAEAYHAGLAPPRRRSIQKKFMSGKLRVVVATIAFGMGLDKPDVRAIIHYNMPKNFESYVQEIGRAGRDGLDSHCHLFLDCEQHDLWEQQRHIFSNGVDRHTLRKLLKKVFPSCKCSSRYLKLDNDSEQIDSSCSETHISCSKHEVAFSIAETVQELDVKQENISTLLCYLELHPKKWIELLSPTYSTCSIQCYGGSQQMQTVASKNPSLSAAIALDEKNGKKWKKCSQYSFDIVKVASAIGCKSSTLKQSLKSLEWKNKRKTGVMVEFTDLAFHVLAPGNLTDEEKDLVLEFLYSKVIESEQSQLKSLRLLSSVFQKYSSSHYWDCCDEVNIEYSEAIKNSINKYFEHHDLLLEEISEEETNIEKSNEVDLSYVRQLVKDIICTNHDQNFTGRAIARIFHGISSPCFPSEVWGKVHKFWRCLLPVDFATIMKIANEELRNSK